MKLKLHQRKYTERETHTHKDAECLEPLGKLTLIQRDTLYLLRWVKPKALIITNTGNTHSPLLGIENVKDTLEESMTISIPVKLRRSSWTFK